MNDTCLREIYSKVEAKEEHRLIRDMRKYIIAAKRQQGITKCERCAKISDKYELHHVMIVKNTTINDLQLLCPKCHKAVTDYRPLKYRVDGLQTRLL